MGKHLLNSQYAIQEAQKDPKQPDKYIIALKSRSSIHNVAALTLAIESSENQMTNLAIDAAPGSGYWIYLSRQRAWFDKVLSIKWRARTAKAGEW